MFDIWCLGLNKLFNRQCHWGNRFTTLTVESRNNIWARCTCILELGTRTQINSKWAFTRDCELILEQDFRIFRPFLPHIRNFNSPSVSATFLHNHQKCIIFSFWVIPSYYSQFSFQQLRIKYFEYTNNFQYSLLIFRSTLNISFSPYT